MGGIDKCLVSIAGKPILDHIVALVAPQVAGLVLSANGDPARFARWGLPVLPDAVTGRGGPLVGILAALEWALARRPEISDVLSVPGDAPFPPSDLLAVLAAARDAAGATIAMAAAGGQANPVMALWPVALAPRLRLALEEEGAAGVGRFARSFPLAMAEVAESALVNVNTAEDLEQIVTGSIRPGR